MMVTIYSKVGAVVFYKIKQFNCTLKSDRNFIYKIIIDKKSYLPHEITQANTVNNDFIKTRFTDIKTNVTLPPESSWFYSTYTNKYDKESQTSIVQLLKSGSLAPGWRLENYNSNKTISLNELRGKVVLLDFWIKNCGPCIQSVPHLNYLKAKFKNEKFTLISINSYDSKEDVIWFCNKFKVKYPVLLNGKVCRRRVWS